MTDKIQSVMTKNPITLAVDHHPGEAIEVMRNSNFRYLPVVDHNRELRGMVSQHDLMALDLKEMFLKSTRRSIVDFFKFSPIYILIVAIMIYIASRRDAHFCLEV
jgi:CBS-domain-containing membrane protein